MKDATIERHDKLNGQTRWNVLYKGRWVGQFYTRERAQAFRDSELAVAVARGCVR